MKEIIKSYSEEDTFNFGFELAKTLKQGDVIALFGDLGVGKTAFTKGVAKYFDIDYVTSPTFTLVNEYYGDINLYHFDAYRINSDDWLNSGFDEYLFNDGICIIEWSENIKDILPENAIMITISKDLTKDYEYRNITIER